MKRFAIVCVSLCALLLSQCGGGNWVEMAGINCDDMKKMQEDKGLMKKDTLIQVARGYCAQSGKTFGGDFRCGDHGAQAKCKCRRPLEKGPEDRFPETACRRVRQRPNGFA